MQCKSTCTSTILSEMSWQQPCSKAIRMHFSRDMRFPTMWYVRPAKPQISLCIRTVWSEPLLAANMTVKLLTQHHLEFLSLAFRVYSCQKSTLFEISCRARDSFVSSICGRDCMRCDETWVCPKLLQRSGHSERYILVCVSREASDQLAHPRSLIRFFSLWSVGSRGLNDSSYG